MPAADRRGAPAADRTRVVGELVAVALLGVLTGLLGTGVHLARDSVLGVLLPWGLALAVALVVATDLAVAAATPPGRRPGPGGVLLAVALGRGLVLGVLLWPRAGGDVVLTGLPASTVWILVSVLVPAFVAPIALALSVRARGPAVHA